MVRICNELRPDHDFILIDSPAGIERGFRNAIAPADRVLVVTNPEVSAVRDADRVIGILEAEEKRDPALIINRLNPSLVKQHDMLSAEDVLDLLGIPLIGIVPEDEAVIVGSQPRHARWPGSQEPGGAGISQYRQAHSRRRSAVPGHGQTGRAVGPPPEDDGEEMMGWFRAQAQRGKRQGATAAGADP